LCHACSGEQGVLANVGGVAIEKSVANRQAIDDQDAARIIWQVDTIITVCKNDELARCITQFLDGWSHFVTNGQLCADFLPPSCCGSRWYKNDHVVVAPMLGDELWELIT
jgi:hypothetical protein